MEGKKFYKEFLNAKEGIATNILADRLKKLEQNGMVQSKVYEKMKTKKEYSLTSKGKDLIPIVVEMILWSAKHQEGLAISEHFLSKAKDDRAGLIAAIQSSLD